MFLEHSWEYDRLNGACEINKVQEAHALAILGENVLCSLYKSAQDKLDALEVFLCVSDTARFCQFLPVFIKRVSRYIESEKFLFPRKTLIVRGRFARW